MRKILITGSTGMLGSSLVQLFSSDNRYEVYGLSRSLSPYLAESKQYRIDLSQPIDQHQITMEPEIIIHTAAVTDLGLCERDPGLAECVHVHASEILTRLIKKGNRFIYISTDSVFDGNKGNYSETDSPNPLNVYAKTKLKGEEAVLQCNRGLTTVIRTNIYGFHLPCKNSLAEWAFREWSSGKTIFGFSDIFFNAVHTDQLSEIAKHICDNSIDLTMLNVAGDNSISKFEFLNAFRHALGMDNSLLRTAESADFPSSIQRPKNTSLNTELLSSFYKVPDLATGINLWKEKALRAGILKPDRL